MSEELSIPNQNIVSKAGELEVTAITPDEMLHANSALITWCEQKINALHTDHIELDAAYKHAVERKWKSTTLKRHAEIARKRMEFYIKIKGALDAGFYIVPNFPIDIFAIRTDKKLKVLDVREATNYRPHQQNRQFSSESPAGDGEYKNPFPVVCQYQTKDEHNSKSIWASLSSVWAEFEFPIAMSKPVIMEAATRAMALKIFDEIGLLGSAKSGDPMIIGRMIDPRQTGSKLWRRHVSFVIAWHLNTATI